ncbi:MAG: hypothetical protein WD003_00235 [Candidatus Paceibacterota bacterium]
MLINKSVLNEARGSWVILFGGRYGFRLCHFAKVDGEEENENLCFTFSEVFERTPLPENDNWASQGLPINEGETWEVLCKEGDLRHEATPTYVCANYKNTGNLFLVMKNGGGKMFFLSDKEVGLLLQSGFRRSTPRKIY